MVYILIAVVIIGILFVVFFKYTEVLDRNSIVRIPNYGRLSFDAKRKMRVDKVNFKKNEVTLVNTRYEIVTDMENVIFEEDYDNHFSFLIFKIICHIHWFFE